MQLGVIRRSDRISDGDLAFMCKAVNDQVFECATAWGIEPWPVTFYSKEAGLPDEVMIIAIVDDVAMAGTLGYHDDWAGLISAQVLAQGPATSVTLSHEALEMLVDPHVNRWATLPDGKHSIAVEACDPVEGDTYTETVEILGESRPVLLSNYVFPSYFNPRGVFPFDRMKRLASGMPAMTPFGYYIQRDDNRNISNVFASGMPPGFGRKLTNPISRTLRRLGNRGGDE